MKEFWNKFVDISNKFSGAISILGLLVSIFSLILIGNILEVKQIERNKFLQFINQVSPQLANINNHLDVIESENFKLSPKQIDSLKIAKSDAKKVLIIFDNWERMMKLYFFNE